MADQPQMPTLLIPCLVIQENNTIFKTEDNVVGKIYDVPCRQVQINEVPYWMVPAKNDGIFSILQPILAVGADTAPPTYDSIYTLQVVDKLSDTTWWIYTVNGKNDFINACATCCMSPAIPMPGTDGSFLIMVVPYFNLCETNADGLFELTFGLPTLEAGQNYFPYGSFNNAPLPAANPAGYATVADLLAFMNSEWSVGSPGIVWSATGLTLFSTGGSFWDELGVVVIATSTSP